MARLTGAASRRHQLRRAGGRRRSALLLVPVGLALLAYLSSAWKIYLHSLATRGGAELFHSLRRQPRVRRAVEYIEEYAAHEAAGYPEECRQRYHGLPFLQTINASWREPVCTTQGGALNSSLRCWFQFDTYAEAYCTGANLALDLAKFAEEDAALPHVTGNQNVEGYFQEHPRQGLVGELLGDCRLNATVDGQDKWQEASFGKGGQKWLFRSFKSTLGGAAQPACVAWVEHPVYLLGDKYDSRNIWHALEDVTHAFEAYALKGWGRDAQVVVLDQLTPESVLGPTYLPVWQKVYSPTRPPALLRSLAENATARARAASGGQLPPGAALCFRDVFFNVHGGISVLSRSIGGWTPCLNSTMMNALVHFVLDGLQLHDIHPASHQAPGGAQAQRPKLRVLWALRSNRAAYQQQVLAQLQQRLPSESNAEVMAVEFGGLSIEEQIRRVRQADVLVGYHGAALTLALFMNRHSGLVEIEESFRCACYTNCALWRGHPYSLIRAGEFAGDAALAARVTEETQRLLKEVEARLRPPP